MKIKYSIFLLVIAAVASYLFVDARSRDYNPNDPIADYYMPLVKTKETFTKNVIDDYQLVVTYIYELTDKQERPTFTADGKETRSARYTQVDHIYKLVEGYAKDHEDRFDDAGEKGVKFVGVNLTSGDLNKLKKEYDITGADSLLFFYKGELQHKHSITSQFNASQLLTFLDAAKFDDFLDDEISRQDRKEARRYKSSRPRRYYYSRPSISFGYGYGPYYGGYGGYWGGRGRWGYGGYGGFGWGW